MWPAEANVSEYSRLIPSKYDNWITAYVYVMDVLGISSVGILLCLLYFILYLTPPSMQAYKKLLMPYVFGHTYTSTVLAGFKPIVCLPHSVLIGVGPLAHFGNYVSTWLLVTTLWIVTVNVDILLAMFIQRYFSVTLRLTNKMQPPSLFYTGIIVSNTMLTATLLVSVFVYDLVILDPVKARAYLIEHNLASTYIKYDDIPIIFTSFDTSLPVKIAALSFFVVYVLSRAIGFWHCTRECTKQLNLHSLSVQTQKQHTMLARLLTAKLICIHFLKIMPIIVLTLALKLGISFLPLSLIMFVIISVFPITNSVLKLLFIKPYRNYICRYVFRKKLQSTPTPPSFGMRTSQKS